MTFDRYRRRKRVNVLVSALAFLCAAITIIPLLMILGHLLAQGAKAVNLDFFTQLPKPVGEVGGGMANAIVGTLILIGLACLVGLPIGIIGGIYLAEFGNNKTGWLVRFMSDVLNGTPSIVIGIFAYTVVVLPMKRFSALAGGFALGIIMIPTVIRATEELVKLVPTSVREAGLALGIPQWRVILRIVVPSAKAGIVTGVLLAVARIGGETAPLLFTAFGNQFWQRRLDQPIASLPVQIFTYAISPFEDWHRQAWAGALVLVAMILITSVLTRVVTKGQDRSMR
ncbi:MAG: phosphate ABC transporter permease PstA [candidate division NC10 bacterium]|nr:phosphate ABC transporter permease PstA [candidate division NC10 bacterium]